MKFLILGRSGSGKDTVAQRLTIEHGLKQLISTTTRPRRYPGECTHVFVTEKEANNLTERVAETVIDGYQYFATKKQLEEADIYIIDPKGLSDVCKNSPKTEICVIYVYASDESRKQRAIWRAADPKKAEEIFISRNASEDEQFSSFEELLFQKELSVFNERFPSVTTIAVINNDDANITKVYEDASKINRLMTLKKLRKVQPYTPMYYEF